MRLPDGSTLMHGVNVPYDPAKAHEYYLRVRKLKGRKKGSDHLSPIGKPPAHAHAPAREKEKKVIGARITELEGKLKKLEDLIKAKEAVVKRNQQAAKPPTAADKNKKAREAKKFRKKHKQQLQTKAKQAAKSGGGSSKGTSAKSKTKGGSIKELKALATKIKGQIAIAKTNLRAL